jgi:hypothetical protein
LGSRFNVNETLHSELQSQIPQQNRQYAAVLENSFIKQTLEQQQMANAAQISGASAQRIQFHVENFN